MSPIRRVSAGTSHLAAVPPDERLCRTQRHERSDRPPRAAHDVELQGVARREEEEQDRAFRPRSKIRGPERGEQHQQVDVDAAFPQCPPCGERAASTPRKIRERVQGECQPRCGALDDTPRDKQQRAEHGLRAGPQMREPALISGPASTARRPGSPPVRSGGRTNMPAGGWSRGLLAIGSGCAMPKPPGRGVRCPAPFQGYGQGGARDIGSEPDFGPAGGGRLERNTREEQEPRTSARYCKRPLSSGCHLDEVLSNHSKAQKHQTMVRRSPGWSERRTEGRAHE